MNVLIIILFFVIQILIFIAIWIWFKQRIKNDLKKAKQLNESIKNYNEKILINLNEYQVPNEIKASNGKEFVEKNKFLDISKSNELFKHGKKAIGIITEIIDERDYYMNFDINPFQGEVYLIVEFENYKGRKYKVKTPAISADVYNYVSIGQKVEVYYDSNTWKMEPYIFQWQSGYHKENFDDLDFFVTNIKGDKISNIKGDKISNGPSIIKIIAYIFFAIIAFNIIYSFLN